MRALVVEDDPAWQQILAEILTEVGLATDLAGDLETSIEIMRARPHRLAVVDLSLGGEDHHNLDGLRVLKALARYDPNCVKLMLTGYATVELAVDVMHDYGALTCLRKETFRRAEFREWLHRALVTSPGLVGHSGVKAIQEPPERGELEALAARDELPGDIPVAGALVVEDDAGWRSLLSELLLEAGYRVTLCSSYVEALGQLRRNAFDLLVVDLSLASSLEPEPNQDGYRLLSNPEIARLPTIVVSGYAEPARIEQAYAELGILACLEKQSFDRETFLAALREVKTQRAGAHLIGTLTRREREVLKFLSRGYTNKKIAQTIHISTNTVKRHLKSIFNKLEVNSRAAATAKAMAARIIEE